MNFNNADLKIYNMETNEEIINTTLSDFTVDIEPSSCAKENLIYNSNFEIQMDNFYISPELKKLLITPSSSPKFKMQGTHVVYVQARTHKKRRINKKWLKRYGMKEKLITFEADCELDSLNTQNGEMECKLENLKYTK